MLRPTYAKQWEELRPQFKELLFTWSLRESELRLEDDREPPNPEASDWQLQYERRYGVGEPDPRKHLFDSTLASLRKGDIADPVRVLGALRKARESAISERTSWLAARLERQWWEHGTEVREALRTAASQFLELHGSSVKNPMTSACSIILENIDSYPLLNRPIPAEARQGKAGHQPEPWMEVARLELKAAGVSKRRDQTALLVAVGLLPYSARPR